MIFPAWAALPASNSVTNSKPLKRALSWTACSIVSSSMVLPAVSNANLSSSWLAARRFPSSLSVSIPRAPRVRLRPCPLARCCSQPANLSGSTGQTGTWTPQPCRALYHLRLVSAASSLALMSSRMTSSGGASRTCSRTFRPSPSLPVGR